MDKPFTYSSSNYVRKKDLYSFSNKQHDLLLSTIKNSYLNTNVTKLIRYCYNESELYDYEVIK